MSKFILTTDSGCDLSIDFCKENDIRPLFMEYEKNGKIYTDTMNHTDLKEFYAGMASGDVIHTSAVNIDSYIKFFEPLLKEGLPIVHIAMGSAISGTYSNGLLAREELLKDYPDAQIHIVDSTLASASYGLLAAEVAEMRDNGATAEECVDYLNCTKKSVNAIYTTADLTYLYRGGRVKKSSMVFAHALGIMPILNLNDLGELKVFDKCRGRRSTYNRIVETVKELCPHPENQTLYVGHSDFAHEATNLGTMLKESVGFKDVFYTYIGSTIGAHAGPNLVTIFFKGVDRKPTDK